MTTTYINKNPNDTLAEFFKRKGDQPLNDIEVEGVLSLINKTQTPDGRPMFPNRTTIGYSRTAETSRNTSLIHGCDTTVGASNTPNSTILRPSNLRSSVRISTPMYRAHPKRHRYGRIGRMNGYRNSTSKMSKMESPLERYRQKKAREAKKAKKAEEKAKEAKKSIQVHKKRKVINHGVIDLTHICSDTEEDDNGELAHKKSEDTIEVHLPTQKVKPLSETAQKVLSILQETDNPSVKSIPAAAKNEKPKRKKEGKQQQFTFGGLTGLKKQQDNISDIHKTASKEHTTISSAPKKNVAPNFTFVPKASAQTSPLKPSSVTIPPANFSLKENSTKTSPVSASLLSSFGKVPSKSPITSPTKFSIQAPATKEPQFKSLFEPTKSHANEPSASNIEIIDKFVFPDVTSSNRTLVEILKGSNETAQKAEVVDRFTFPQVPLGNSALLSEINDRDVHLYDDRFKFEGLA